MPDATLPRPGEVTSHMAAFIESEYDAKVVAMLRDTAAPGQYAARNAVRHIDQAYLLVDVDPPMAAFRAITAEEEAATAVFHALRLQVSRGEKVYDLGTRSTPWLRTATVKR